MATRNCMTCQKDFEEGDPEIFIELEAFEDICICQACVRVYRKEAAPDPSATD